jgi:hypothetical protein
MLLAAGAVVAFATITIVKKQRERAEHERMMVWG